MISVTPSKLIPSWVWTKTYLWEFIRSNSSSLSKMSAKAAFRSCASAHNAIECTKKDSSNKGSYTDLSCNNETKASGSCKYAKETLPGFLSLVMLTKPSSQQRATTAMVAGASVWLQLVGKGNIYYHRKRQRISRVVKKEMHLNVRRYAFRKAPRAKVF